MGASIEIDGVPLRIEGVVADVRYVVQDETPDPLVYLPLGARGGSRMRVVVRTGDAPARSDATIRTAVAAVAPDQAAEPARTVRSVLDGSLVPQRVGAAVVGSLGGVALLLAVLGLYALVHHAVRAQTRTLGIRMALGGGKRDAIGWVLRSAFVLVGIGLALGVVLALLVTRPLRPFLQGVAPHDPATYLGVLVVFATAAVLAGWGPALRASRIDPAVALRSD